MFDVAFDKFWRQHSGGQIAAPARPARPAGRVAAAPTDRQRPQNSVPQLARRRARRRRVIGGAPSGRGATRRRSRAKDFAAFSPAEIADARNSPSPVSSGILGERRTRRWVRGRGPRIDLRRAISESLRTGGDIVTLSRRRRRIRPRPLVLLCDVSGSMERYSRMLLHFAHAVARRHRRVEAFLFSTELTRITRELRLAASRRCAGAVSRAVPRLVGRHAHRRGREGVSPAMEPPGARRRTGGADHFRRVGLRRSRTSLRDQIARLQRSSHRLIWLNPLIGTADYAPLTRGLQAALPFVDDFLPARTLDQSRGPGGTLEHARVIAAQTALEQHRWKLPAPTRSTHPPERVWAAADGSRGASSSCIPGCERFDPDGRRPLHA